jgi:hypothetical protein
MVQQNNYIPAEILIKFVNFDESENISNNERKQLAIIVVIPHDVTQIVVDGCIKKGKYKTNVHYTICVQQNAHLQCTNRNSTKFATILWDLIKFLLLKSVDKIPHFLHQGTFENKIKKVVRIFNFIRFLFEWWDYVSYIVEHLNSDWFINLLHNEIDIIRQLCVITIIQELLRISEYILTTF